MSLDKSSMKTRSQSTVEQNDPALVQEVIKDILQSKSFLSLVEESITNRVKEMEETIEKQTAQILDLETSNKDKTKQITDLQKRIKEHNASLDAIDLKLDAQEQYSRRTVSGSSVALRKQVKTLI